MGKGTRFKEESGVWKDKYLVTGGVVCFDLGLLAFARANDERNPASALYGEHDDEAEDVALRRC